MASSGSKQSSPRMSDHGEGSFDCNCPALNIESGDLNSSALFRRWFSKIRLIDSSIVYQQKWQSRFNVMQDNVCNILPTASP